MSDATSSADGAGLPQLPLDPDVEADQARTGEARPIHLRPSSLALVFAGGTVGTAAREALSLAIPALNGIPLTILAINVTGAFLLGVLLDALARRGPDLGRRRVLRLLLGTGFMGGFTTYSALAADSAALIGDGRAGAGILYALVTLVVGGAATWAGIAVAASVHRIESRRAAR